MPNFAGYPLKINGAVLSGFYIAPNTWTVKREKVLIRSWRDMTGTMHEDYYPPRKAVIAFELRQHNAAEHALLLPFFSAVNNVSVEYWDDSTGDYVSGVFRINEPEWKHLVTRSNDIVYDYTSVTLEEL